MSNQSILKLMKSIHDQIDDKLKNYKNNFKTTDLYYDLILYKSIEVECNENYMKDIYYDINLCRIEKPDYQYKINNIYLEFHIAKMHDWNSILYKVSICDIEIICVAINITTSIINSEIAGVIYGYKHKISDQTAFKKFIDDLISKMYNINNNIDYWLDNEKYFSIHELFKSIILNKVAVVDDCIIFSFKFLNRFDNFILKQNKNNIYFKTFYFIANKYIYIGYIEELQNFYVFYIKKLDRQIFEIRDPELDLKICIKKSELESFIKEYKLLYEEKYKIYVTTDNINFT